VDRTGITGLMVAAELWQSWRRSGLGGLSGRASRGRFM
jgi:hypothetical protein